MLTIKVLLLVSSLYSTIHSWYPPKCCSDQDCEVIECSEILELDKGDYKYDGLTFRRDNVEPSQDGNCHACMAKYKNSTGTETKVPRCLFIIQSY